MRGVFITGTDTGVGKTVIAAGLLRRLRRAGVDAAPMKPVQTGAERAGERLVSGDLERCLAAAGMSPSEEERSAMCPFLYAPACSPHLAGRLAGSYPAIAAIEEAAAFLAARHAAVLVEGAGGVLAPLNERETMLDLMAALALPVLLVARGTLGTINHSLLALRALRGAGLAVVGVVTNDCDATPRDAVWEDNPRAIAQFVAAPILGEIPHLGRAATPEAWERFDAAFTGFDALVENLGL